MYYILLMTDIILHMLFFTHFKNTEICGYIEKIVQINAGFSQLHNFIYIYIDFR